MEKTYRPTQIVAISLCVHSQSDKPNPMEKTHRPTQIVALDKVTLKFFTLFITF